MAKNAVMKKGVDPVSGNEKPVGSLPKEVRDDVPAMLSEGEFVLPADVVRYIGLNNIMKLRDAAKQGLSQMEAQGQMGNSEEAITEETTPSDDMTRMTNDILREKGDPVEMATGGMLSSAQYTPVLRPAPKPVKTVDPVNTTTTPVQPVSTVVAASSGAEQPTPYQTPDVKTYLPANAPGAVEDITYVGPNGEEITIRFIGGNPSQPIPAGFKRKDEVEQQEETEQEETVETPTEGVVCPAGTAWNGTACVPITTQSSSSDSQPVETTEKATDTSIALAAVLAKDNPEIATLLKDYQAGRAKVDNRSFLETIFGLLAPGGIISAIKEGITLGKQRSEILEAIEGSKVGIPASILNDWSKSTRTETEIMESAQKAMDAGASSNVALAIATDDNFDAEVLNLPGLDLASWEQAVADTYGVDVNSDQMARMAKEDLDLFDGDLEAYKAFQEGESYNIGDTGFTDADGFQSAIDAGESAYDFDAELAAFEAADFDAIDAYEDSLLSGGSSSFNDSSDSGSSSDYFGGDTSGGWTSNDYDDFDAAISQDNANSGGGSGGGSGGDSGGGGSYCCTKMVQHKIWNSRREFVQMHKWHMEQPQWWRDGYDVWGNVVAETFLKRNTPFWTSVMQSFYARKVQKKAFTFKTALAYAIIYPGVAAYGLVAKVKGKHVYGS